MEERKLDFVCIGVDDGGRIPVENTGRGRDKSPEFLLSNLSPRAKTLAVTLEDMSHPIRNFTHWVIWNIPAANHIQGGIAAGKPPPLRGVRGRAPLMAGTNTRDPSRLVERAIDTALPCIRWIVHWS